MRKNKIRQCEFCGGDTKIEKVKKQHWFNKKLYIVENVEADVCQECGEKYFHAKTLDNIDKLIIGKHDVKEIISVEVISA